MRAVLDSKAIIEQGRRYALATLESPKEFDRAKQSVRRAAGTESKRAVVAIYNLKAGRAGEDIKTQTTPAGVAVSGGNKPITLLSYGFTQNSSGLRGRVFKAGSVSSIKSGFINRGLGGGLVPFRREGEKRRQKAGRYAGKMRQPIRGLYGPSVADAMKNQTVSSDMRERILGRAGAELRRRLLRLGGK